MTKLLSCAAGHFWETADAPTVCPECGAPPDDFPDLEPAAVAPAPAAAAPVEAAGKPVIAGYEILEELARGPTGVRRFRAKQERVGREVLLEVVLAREDPSQRAWSSLRSEAGLLGKLSHPHVVPIHDAGERDRQVFYNVLELVAGPTLADKLGDRLLPVADAVRLVEILARAVEAAHRQQVLHRHLEPAAVLLQACEGEQGGLAVRVHDGHYLPRISGFGLARRPVEGDPTDAELYADVGFLAPEQAWGRTKEVGPATDVYGLGGVLYWLLTRRAPFRGPALGDVIDAIQTATLVIPRDIERVPNDVEFVCLKALARKPKHRYATAAELADDLRRVAAGRPPAGRPSSVGRWAWRNKLVAALAALSVVLLAVIAVMALTRGGGMDSAERFRLQHANHAERVNALNRQRELEHQIAGLQEELGVSEYQGRIEQANAALGRKDVEQARRLLRECPEDACRFEWHYLVARCAGRERRVVATEGPPTAVAVAPGDHLVVAVGTAEGGRGRVVIWDGKSRFLAPLLVGPPRGLAFSPHGRQLAGVSGTERGELWYWPSIEAGDALQVQRLAFDDRGLTDLAWAVGGTSVLVARSDHLLVPVDLTRPLSPGTAFGRGGASDLEKGRTRVAVHPAGTLAASWVAGLRGVQQWNLRTRRPDREFAGPPGSGSVLVAAYSIDGYMAVGRDDDSVRFHDGTTGTELFRVENLPKPIRQLAFSADGKRLAVALDGGTVRVYAMRKRAAVPLLDVPADATVGLAFAPNGKAIAVAGATEAVVFGAVRE